MTTSLYALPLPLQVRDAEREAQPTVGRMAGTRALKRALNDALDELSELSEKNEVSENALNCLAKKLKAVHDIDADSRQCVRIETVVAMAAENPWVLPGALCSDVVEVFEHSFLSKVLKARRHHKDGISEDWVKDMVDFYMPEWEREDSQAIFCSAARLLDEDADVFSAAVERQLREELKVKPSAMATEDADLLPELLALDARLITWMLEDEALKDREELIDLALDMAQWETIRGDKRFQESCGIDKADDPSHATMHRLLSRQMQQAIAEARPSSPCAPGGPCSFNEDRRAP